MFAERREPSPCDAGRRRHRGRGRRGCTSAVLRAARTDSADPSVDSSLDDFITRANAMLVDMGGWGLGTGEAASVQEAQEREALEAAAREREAELQARLDEARAELADVTARLREAARQADAVSAAEPQPAGAERAPGRRAGVAWLPVLGAFAAGVVVMLGLGPLVGSSAPREASPGAAEVAPAAEVEAKPAHEPAPEVDNAEEPAHEPAPEVEKKAHEPAREPARAVEKKAPATVEVPEPAREKPAREAKTPEQAAPADEPPASEDTPTGIVDPFAG